MAIAISLTTIFSFGSITFASTTAQGTCGSSVTWELEDGVLTISGSGKMSDYYCSCNYPWADYSDEITSVVIGSGVTYIGNYSFYDCTAIEEVTVSKSVTKIGNYAFADCSALTTVSGMAGVTYIGYNAFYYCTSLSSIPFTSKLTTIGSLSFYNCKSLSTLTLPDSVSFLGSTAFKNCTGLKYVDTGSGVSEIESGTFCNCTGIKTLIIGSSVSTIGDGAFKNCSGITQIFFEGDIPGSVYWNAFYDVTATAFCYNGTSGWTTSAMEDISDDFIWYQINEGAESLEDASVTLSSTSFTYTGSAIEPSVTVTLSGSTLTKGTDYTVSYSDNTSAGTATVTITGMNDYYGTVSKTFTISAQSLSSSNVTLSSTSFTYSGSTQKPTVTVKNSAGTTLTSGTDYSISYSTTYPKSAGTYTITITGKGNYKGTITKTYKITAKSIKSASVTLSSTSLKYTGSVIKPSVTVKLSGSTLSSSNYTVTYSSNKAIGTATVKITGKGNYTGTITKTFKIVPKTMSIKSATGAKKKITVKWSKTSGSVTGYQIRYRVKGSSSWTTKTVSSSTTSKTLTGLKSGKTYQVQIRAYKTVNGTKYYGSWSSTKTVKTK